MYFIEEFLNLFNRKEVQIVHEKGPQLDINKCSVGNIALQAEHLRFATHSSKYFFQPDERVHWTSLGVDFNIKQAENIS